MGTRAGALVVASATLGSGMAFLDGSVVNVALRSIGEDLDASLAELQWITNGYLLSLSSLILLGGSLGDRFGRRRIFVIGTIWFAAASLLCAIAPTVEALIAARAHDEHAPLDELTRRELEILGHMAQGKSNQAIAEELFLSKRAVEKHINAIFMKLGLAHAEDVSRRVKAALIYLAGARDDSSWTV